MEGGGGGRARGGVGGIVGGRPGAQCTESQNERDINVTTNTIWISYDLGVQGDYESVYAWLDSQDAKECGDSLAVLKYKHDGDIKHALKVDLKKAISVTKRTRIYVIYRDQETGANKGSFIFGGRRAPPWTGYHTAGGVTDDVEI